jgi:ComF family protein
MSTVQMEPLARIGTAFLQLLAPARCPGCDAAAPHPGGFCDGCAPLLEGPAAAYRPPAPVAAAFAYGGPIADAIARLKYGRRSDLAGALALLLADAALPYAGLVDRVAPLPLHPQRLRERGFNQSALLALRVATVLGVPLEVGSLQRIRPTREQAGLPREQRASNIRGAFRVGGGGRIRGLRVLLIDDVCTTGATLDAAAHALRAAGASEVRALALARAEG